ncbi:MAG: RNA-binding transcriptional accessory protein [Bacteroidales bacterium]|nr:RNA-binding transcriptional accessory protein [Bacteroidales bacterium]MCF8336618.1 RNA-binding transcriptional accessory protein [Bacteroidales bacterium]
MPNNEKYTRIIANETGLKAWQVAHTIELLNDGGTVPFISRYRKEATGSLDEVKIINIRDRLNQLKELDKRRDAIIKSISEQGKLTDDLRKQIENAETMAALEDLYLPFKPKKKTRASIARSKGLEPLAGELLQENMTNPQERAEAFVNTEQNVNTAGEALQGARDIIAEWINEDKEVRAALRTLFFEESYLVSSVIKGKEQKAEKYEPYFDYEEAVADIPSHRILAMFRGESEEFLRLKIEAGEEDAIGEITSVFLKPYHTQEQVYKAIADAYSRLLRPSMENEVRAWLKQKADEKAIEVFGQNVRQLLLASPLGGKNIMAIDPGFRTGCKVVCLDRNGNLLHNETIYPHPPHKDVKTASKKLRFLANAYKVDAIAVGNGTAGRETEQFVQKVKFERDLIAMMVNENGASVYSASRVAREEFPEYDVTVRGAVSIGRRLMDPLAELVKIDPKSIGVGQYQHDVDQKELQKSLSDTVESCVNTVGVDVNTASKELLTHVSGIGPSLASQIIEHRKQKGGFKSRRELKEVKRFGEKTFEQSAGFLRIPGAENPLDASAVHPESYPIVKKMASSLNATVSELMSRKELRRKLDLEKFVTDKAGLPTLNDIMQELEKPGRDPREEFELFTFDDKVNKIEDVKEGMVLPGIVTNITDFGAFVDIGVHQDGLVHISNMADKFIKDPNEVVVLNQKVQVKVLDVDVDRKRIQLSMKDT